MEFATIGPWASPRGGLALFIAMLLAGTASVGEAGAQQAPQQQGLAYPDVIYDPDQGEPQANPQVERQGTLFPGLQFPGRAELADLRRRAFENYGLTFAASYQQLFQWTSATLPNARHNTALGGWAAVAGTWTPLDRGGDFEGTFVVRAAWRGPIGNTAAPAILGVTQIGSVWSNYEFTDWNGKFVVEDLFWQQKLWGDRVALRFGNLGAQVVFNFFRFKDARTGFTSSPFAFGETIPYPTFGLGGSIRVQPSAADPDFYVVGTLNDMNGDPAGKGFDWGTFGLGQYFYGIEVGKNWRRANGEFDHFHIDVFYADERSTRSPNTTPNKAGAGFKIAGEKQLGRIVGFANYTYNTAEGGGIGATLAAHTAVAGVAYVRPFNILGEASLGFMWAQALPSLAPAFPRKDQYGLEAYWNIGVTPNVNVTPGLQLIFNPMFNPTVDVVAVPHIKFRIAL